MSAVTPQSVSPGLPQPRKWPGQARSKALVEAVLQACWRILDHEGAAALTVQRVAEVSGVAVGSIYQYFPSKEAIVALVYERVLQDEAEYILTLRPTMSGAPLKEVLGLIVANTVRVELRLFRLNSEFHLKYYKALQLGMRCGAYRSSCEYVEDTWVKLLQLYPDEVGTPDLSTAAYMLGMGLRAVIRQALEDDPERVATDGFLQGLIGMACGSVQVRDRPADTGRVSEGRA